MLDGKTAPEAGLLKDRGKLLSPEESLEFLANTHFPGSSDSPCKDKRTNRRKKVNITKTEVDFISLEKVKASIASFQPHKSPGPDLIPPCVYQHFGERALELLVRLFKSSYL